MTTQTDQVNDADYPTDEHGYPIYSNGTHADIAKAHAEFEALAQPEQEPDLGGVGVFYPTEQESYGLAAYVIGCFRAAEVEGLQEALAETTDEHLKDLVERRLMHALYAAQNTTPPQRKPLTDEMVVAAARLLNQRHADACGVDGDDLWALHSEDFKEDASALLKAAHGIKGDA